MSPPPLPTGRQVYPPPVRDCVVMAGRGQRDSFGSFRIAVVWRLWATVLMLEDDVGMVNRRMILCVKKFRSKASLAAPLSPGQLVDRRRIGFYFSPTFYCYTASQGGGELGGLPVFVVPGGSIHQENSLIGMVKNGLRK